jgi:polyisoprenoid-binding protein YceI
VQEVAKLERHSLRPENLGLMLSEAKELLHGVQKAMVTHQTTRYLTQQISCPECGGIRSHKGKHQIVLRTLLGSLGTAAHAADTFKIDPVHSSVVFSVMHLGVTNFYGRFNDVSGTIVFDKADPSKSSVEVSVPVESVDTHYEKRNQHLKSPDFFNAKQFPVMTFKSNKVEASGDTYKVSGDLTLHGVTKPLTVEFKKGGEGKGMEGEIRGGGETRFTVKRSDFGMNFMQGVVGDEINIVLSVEGIKQ